MEIFTIHKKTLFLISVQKNTIVKSLTHRKQLSASIIHKHQNFTQNIYPKNYLFFMQDRSKKRFVMKYNDLFFHTQNAFYDYINQNYVSFMRNSQSVQRQYFKSHPSEAKQYLFSILGGKDTMSFIQRFFTNRLTWKERSLMNQQEHHFLYENNIVERTQNKDMVLKELVHHYKEVPIKVKEKQKLHEKESFGNIHKGDEENHKNDILYEISEDDLERIVNEVYEKITYKMKLKSYYGG